MLTQSEVDEIGGFCGDTLKRLMRPLPREAFHYTDGAGLVGIVTNQTIRATHIAYMNDASELRYSVTAMRDAAIRRLRSYADADSKAVLTDIEKTLSDTLADPGRLAAIWVACFTEHQDQLSQWRGYGGEEAGYAIAFDAVALAEAGKRKNQGLLLPCTYDREIHVSVVDNALRLLEQLYSAGRQRFSGDKLQLYRRALIEKAFWDLSWLAPMLKHQAFKEEAEWRIYKRTADGDVSGITFVPRRSNISGYITLDLRVAVAERGELLPITGVVVGPSANPSLSRTAIRAMLQQQGYPDLPVTYSEAPFRTG